MTTAEGSVFVYSHTGDSPAEVSRGLTRTFSRDRTRGAGRRNSGECEQQHLHSHLRAPPEKFMTMSIFQCMSESSSRVTFVGLASSICIYSNFPLKKKGKGNPVDLKPPKSSPCDLPTQTG